MARKYPTYALHTETEGKSTGIFLIRLVSPKFISSIDISNQHSPITVLEWLDEDEPAKKEQALLHAKKWLISRL